MEKRRILFLKKPQTQEWHSCKTILENLEHAYTHAFGEELTIADTSNLQSLAAYRPQIIVLADQRLNYEHVIGALKTVINDPIDWVIHAYGCFPGRVTEFMNAYHRMQQDRFKILTASTVFEKMLQQLFVDSNVISRCPFPVSNPTARVSVRDPLREQLGIGPDEKVFLYAGRISYQKNVHKLIHLFRQHPGLEPITLLICGKIDDLNPLMDERGPILGVAKKLFDEEYEAAKSEGRKVIYLGHKSSQELLDLYEAADIYVSLSTHLGEDFGLAAAEALAQGLPCHLSNWGGFQDFSHLPSVKLFHPSKVTAQEMFSPENRLDNEAALQYFGLEAVAKRLTQVLASFPARAALSKVAFSLYMLDQSQTPLAQKLHLYETQFYLPMLSGIKMPNP